MALFRDAVGDVRSINNDKVDTSRTSDSDAKPMLRSSEEDDRSVMESLLEELSENDLLETGEHLSFAQPGIQRSVLKKLKNGHYAIQSEIDLHGLTVSEARIELGTFLREAQTRRHLCIRVIHGKGRARAEQAPRLKPAVNQWLQRNRQVLAFCSARQSDGGTGAVYVLLRKPA